MANRTAYLIVMAPDEADQWNIEKWMYWDGRVFGPVNQNAHPFSSRATADTAAFQMTLNDHSLMGKIHVWHFEAPVAEFAEIRPWRRVDD